MDDWNCEYQAGLYAETLDSARQFHHDHPGTFWCSGTSYALDVRHMVKDGFLHLYQEAAGNHGAALLIDHVLFSHAGISDQFVHKHSERNTEENPQKVVSAINSMKPEELWCDDSPLWLRPKKEIAGSQVKMYHAETCFQVVGHTPMRQITQEGNLLTCDVFSTLRDHTPYGSQEFCLFDTETWKWKGISKEQ